LIWRCSRTGSFRGLLFVDALLLLLIVGDAGTAVVYKTGRFAPFLTPVLVVFVVATVLAGAVVSIKHNSDRRT
jgi:hypothetical protein